MSNVLIYATLAACILIQLGVIIFFAFSLYGGFSLGPYVSSGKKKMIEMLDAADLPPNTKILELGSGDGTLCILAAKKGLRAHGIEINPLLVPWSKMMAAIAGVQDRATFQLANLWGMRLPRDIDAIFVYGLPMSLPRVWEKCRAELAPGTLVISHAFLFTDQEPIRKSGNIRVYRLP